MMILTLSLGGLLLVLTLCFGRAGLKRLAELQLRGGALAVLACLAQILHVLTRQYRLELLIVTAILLVAFCWLNRRWLGITLALIGIMLNMAVMAANGGTMPISQLSVVQMGGAQIPSGTPLLLTKSRVLSDHEMSLAWLSDRLLLPGPLARVAAWSVGDLFLLVGVGSLLWSTMKGYNDVAPRRMV